MLVIEKEAHALATHLKHTHTHTHTQTERERERENTSHTHLGDQASALDGRQYRRLCVCVCVCVCVQRTEKKN